MKIALLHNPRPREVPPTLPDDTYEEYDTPQTLHDIAAALDTRGHSTEPLIADASLPARLEHNRFDFVFNLAEGAGRRCREAIPAAICELFQIPFTGSDAATLAITLDKSLARRVVSPDVPVAPAALVESEADFPVLATLPYPVLVKPNDEGSSKGIRNDSIANTVPEAVRLCRRLFDQYRCPALVEHFLTGTEITVGIRGNGPTARIIGMMEIASAQENTRFVYSIESKRTWRETVRYHIPPRLTPTALAAVERVALLAYRLLGCRDLARIDFRLSSDGTPCFLECNPLPGLNADYSDLVILSRPHIPYADLICNILSDAAARLGVPLP